MPSLPVTSGMSKSKLCDCLQSKGVNITFCVFLLDRLLQTTYNEMIHLRGGECVSCSAGDTTDLLLVAAIARVITHGLKTSRIWSSVL